MAASTSPSAAFPDPYIHLLEAMPDGVVVTDLDGMVIHANGLFEKLSGYPAGELVGRPVERLVPEALNEAHRGHRAGYYEHGMPARPMGAGLDTRLRRADGSEVPVDIALSTLDTGTAAFVIASLRDVTERKLAEATILESERRWSEFLDTVQLAVVAIDLEGRVTYANPFLLRVTDSTVAEVVGADWFDTFVPERDRGELRITLIRSSDVDLQRQHDYDIMTARGERRTLSWVHTRLEDATGELTGVISVGEDITDERRIDARARALNEVAQAILTGGSPESLLHQVARSAAHLLGADAGALLVELAEHRFEVRAVAGDAIESARGRVIGLEGHLVDQVVRTGRSFRVEDVAEETMAANIAALGDVGPALLVPLWVRGEPFGALLVANGRGGRSFTLDDVGEEEAFASQAAVALAYERAQHEVGRLGVLAERERIARELHDTVIQRLFASGMRLQAALGKETEKLVPVVEQVVEDLDGVIRDIRSTIFTLQAAQEKGLRGAIVGLVIEMTGRLGFEPQVRFIGPLDTIVGDDLQAPAITVLRASLLQVARQGVAHRVQVEVSAGEDLVVEVSDDGVRSAAGSIENESAFDEVRVRAESLGGSLSSAERTGGGTVVRWTVPLRMGPVASP